MKANDYAQMCALINAACEYYGKPALSDNALKIYFNGFKHLTIEQVRDGLSAHVGNPDNGQFVPKVADILRGAVGDSASLADAAWAKVRHAVEDVGRYASVAFDDALIHAVVQMMGGWMWLCNCESYEALTWRGKDFVRIYRGLVGKPLPEYPRYLPGIAEVQNAAHGHPVAPPRLLGDSERARLVFEGGSDKPALPNKPMSVGETLKRLGFSVPDESVGGGMTGNILREIREARGIGMADIRDLSPYMAVALARLERCGVSYHKGATGNHNARRRRHWRRAMGIIREAAKRGGR